MNCQVKHNLALELLTVLKTNFFHMWKLQEESTFVYIDFFTLLTMHSYGVADRLAAKRLKTFAMNMFAYQSVQILAWLSGRLWLFWREANHNWPSDFLSAARDQRVGYHDKLSIKVISRTTPRNVFCLETSHFEKRDMKFA